MHTARASNIRTGMDARFAAAKRHSRFVRVLRIAVPATVAVSLALIVGVSIFNPFRILQNLPIDIGNMVVSGTRITMETPHLSGYSPDGRPYELWAKTATQDITQPDTVELTVLRAKVVMEDKSTVTMDANLGVFETKAQTLELQQKIFLQSSTGYEARLTKADINFANGSVKSDEPVDVLLLNGTLRGERMRITESGDLVRFEGGVKMLLKMEEPAAGGEADAAADQPAVPTSADASQHDGALAPRKAASPHAKHAK